MTRLSLVLLCSALLSLPLAADSSRAVILDKDGRALVLLDLDRGAIAQKIALPIAGTQLALSPDGSRAIVLTRGAGTEGWTGRFRPTATAPGAVIDLAAGKVLTRLDLGFGLDDWAFGADGMFYVLSGGYQSTKQDHRGATLLKIDPQSGATVKRLEFTRGADGFGIVEGHGAVFFRAWPKQKLGAELRLVNLATLEETKTVALAGEPEAPVALAGASHLYAIDSRKNGKVEVIGASDGAVAAALDLGESPRLGAIDPESKRVYVIGKKATDGFVHVLRGSELEATIPIALEPLRLQLSADRKWLFVVGQTFKKRFGGFREAFVTRVDLSSLTAGPVVQTGGGKPAAFVVSDDAQKLVLFSGDDQVCCALTVSDIAAGKRLGEPFETGSRGERIGAALLSVAATAASYSAGRSAAQSSGRSTFYYTVFEPRRRGPSRGPLALRGDGKFAYVLDPVTDDLTIGDVETGAKVANFDVGAGVKEIVPLGDGAIMAAVSDATIVLVDTAKNEKAGEVALAGEVNDFAVSPERKHALAVGRKTVVLLDGATGKARHTVTDLVHPVQVVFLDAVSAP